MLEKSQKAFWDAYVDTLAPGELPEEPWVEASVAGDERIADELLQLYLDGKKRAGSGLVADYLAAGDPLPKIGNYWIILDGNETPRCIVRTIRVEHHLFKDITEEVAIAEGEGDGSIAYWKQAHRTFFEPYLESFGVTDLDEAEVVTEFFEVVYHPEDSGVQKDGQKSASQEAAKTCC